MRGYIMPSDYCPECDEHMLHRERLSNLHDKLDELKSDITEANKYYPKIESALNQLISLQEAIRESTTINKELFGRIDKLKDEFYELKLKIQSHQIFIDNIEENKKANTTMRNQIVVSLVMALLSAMGIAYMTVINIKSDIEARAKYTTESVKK